MTLHVCGVEEDEAEAIVDVDRTVTVSRCRIDGSIQGRPYLKSRWLISRGDGSNAILFVFLVPQ